eukprot:tig00020510_g9802.t1
MVDITIEQDNGSVFYVVPLGPGRARVHTRFVNIVPKPVLAVAPRWALHAFANLPLDQDMIFQCDHRIKF